MTAKAWWKSWTIWFNALSLVLIAVEQNWQFLRDVLPPTVYSIGAFALPIVNVLLRVKTNTGVARRDSECWP
ncbi:MAG: hypothetical protein ACPGJF_03210 [Sinimarinibacterium flocculans]|jgi:hypothetical protein|uniref:DUF7940 domain-containing protein n=1 Tax=Sinimarinibacterium flocculans TaxID=985250 RepID=UPI003C44FD92